MESILKMYMYVYALDAAIQTLQTVDLENNYNEIYFWHRGVRHFPASNKRDVVNCYPWDLL